MQLAAIASPNACDPHDRAFKTKVIASPKTLPANSQNSSIKNSVAESAGRVAKPCGDLHGGGAVGGAGPILRLHELLLHLRFFLFFPSRGTRRLLRTPFRTSLCPRQSCASKINHFSVLVEKLGNTN